jgi:membrane fusion protein, multidrug efflux system
MTDTIKTETVEPKRRRRWLRTILLLVVPLAALGAGVEFYLQGGRYVTTDNAYVGAQKILVTPEISGTVAEIKVAEGQMLKAGDVLFTIDRAPFELALAGAQADLLRAQNDFAVLKDNFASFDTQIALARETLGLRQSELDRKDQLLKTKVVAETDVEAYRINVQAAKSALETLLQNQRSVLNQLGGNAAATLDAYAPYLAAKASLAKAQWNLDQTVVKAPMDGIATQVSNIQMGRYLTAGATVFAIVSATDVWVDANPKETDITWLKEGQPVTVSIDAYPGHDLKGKVSSISPGTGSVFSLIPAQNAAGNWVKVVQRVPVRVTFAGGQDLTLLRTGMSASVAIDTGRVRSIGSLIGTEAVAQVALK